MDEVVEAKYIKIVATETHGNTTGEANRYLSGKDLRFYEDTTIIDDTPTTLPDDAPVTEPENPLAKTLIQIWTLIQIMAKLLKINQQHYQMILWRRPG